MEEKKVLTRADQKVEDTWDLSTLYVSDEAYSQDAERLEKKIEEFKGFEGTLLNVESEPFRLITLIQPCFS